jgi:aerobic-type carbon monoxide dehydrogenase small subunit (CoxS/CutS family)
MKIRFELNEELMEIDVSPWESLSDVLRERLGITGTKRGCDTGGCGMCTVLLDGKSTFSCMTPAWRVEGKRVLTVEGLTKNKKLDPLQEAFVAESAPQCGYCTPAMLMISRELLDSNPHPTEDEVKEALSSVLCRCTGYHPYIKAVLRASQTK